MKSLYCNPTILDEFPEFERRAIDALRQPLEDRIVSISRAKGSMVFPANFILVAAMNPSPEGNTASLSEQARMEKKISGPIIDRIDMWIPVPHIEYEKLSERARTAGETERVSARVQNARGKQMERLKETEANANGDMSVRDIENFVPLSENVATLLNRSAQKLSLSPRAYHRTIKLARTIADLDEKEVVGEEHILEALQYRPKM